jgi:hypothetical protein
MEEKKDFTITEVANGYFVEVGTSTYVFKYLEVQELIEFIGKKLIGQKIKVLIV